MKIETLSFDTANGATTAYVAAPDTADGNTPTVILIQEWWGINDNIRDVAAQIAEAGFRAVAPDLYRGKLANTPQEAAAMMQALKLEDGLDTIQKAISKTREIYGTKRKFGIMGFCMGGTYALRAACEMPNEFGAACPFYGDIPPEDVLKNLKVPTRFFAGTKDTWINPQKVNAELREPTEKYRLPVEIFIYEADHAFFNHNRPEVYDAAAANDAWKKVRELFEARI